MHPHTDFFPARSPQDRLDVIPLLHECLTDTAGRMRIVFGEPVIPRPGESLPALTARVQCLVEELFDSGADAIGVPRLAHRHEKLAPGAEPRTPTHAPEPDKQTTQHHWTTAPSPRRHRSQARGRLGESTDERMRN